MASCKLPFGIPSFSRLIAPPFCRKYLIGSNVAFRDDQGRAVGFEFAEKATAVTFVAHAGADSFDEEEHGIGIAIDADFADAQDVAAGFALFPKSVAGAAEKKWTSPVRCVCASASEFTKPSIRTSPVRWS